MFDLAVICYLFLGGLGGGLCVVSAVSGLSVPGDQLRVGPVPEQRRLMTAAFLACAGGLILSALLLLADVGNLPALKYLFIFANANYLVIGAWALAVGIVLSWVLSVLWRAPAAAWGVGLVRVLLVFECVIGAVIAVYTGLFLASMFAVALWDTVWLVALFTLSSLSCALVAFVALANALGLSVSFGDWTRALVRVDVLFLLFEAVCAVGFIAAALQIDPATSSFASARASVVTLLTGSLAYVWWIGFVGLGLVVPFVLDILLLRSKRVLPPYSLQVIVPAFCAFIGGFSLRYCVVMAGMHPVLGF